MTAQELQELQEFRKDSEYLQKAYDRLKKQFENQYVAIKNQDVVDHNSDIDKLIDSIKEKNFDPASTLIEFFHPRNVILVL